MSAVSIEILCKIGFHASSVLWMGSCHRNEKSVRLRTGLTIWLPHPLQQPDDKHPIVKGYTHSYFSIALFSSHQGVFFLHIILYIYAEHPDAYFFMLRIFLYPILQEVSQHTAFYLHRRFCTMMDHEKIKEGVRLMLEGIGEDINREGLLETPDRIARMCEQIYGGLYEDAGVHLSKQFHATNNNIVLEKDITFYSTCEHHLLPFYGKAHVAYIPDQRVAGLSKLARTVEVYARRPQIQENMTAQIADALEEHLQPKGVMVMIEAEHMCMTMRGVQKPGSKTVTTIVRGAFAEDFSLQQTFLQMVKA